MLTDFLPNWWPQLITVLMTLVWFGSAILIYLCVRRPRMAGYLGSWRKRLMVKSAIVFSRFSVVLLWIITAQACTEMTKAARRTPDMQALFCDADFHEGLTIFSLGIVMAYGFRGYRRYMCRQRRHSASFGGLATGYLSLTALSYSALHIAAHGGFV
jgi:hypothetical protein